MTMNFEVINARNFWLTQNYCDVACVKSLDVGREKVQRVLQVKQEQLGAAGQIIFSQLD